MATQSMGNHIFLCSRMSSDKSKRLKEGETNAVSPTVNKVIQPPKTTAVTVPINFAVSPLSKAPNSLEDPTKMELTDATRPRILSGVFNCKIVCLMIMETPSTAPLTKSAITESQKSFDNPKTRIQIPNPNTAQSSFFPAFLCKGNRVESTMVMDAPTAGAALKIPNPSEPTLKCPVHKWAKGPLPLQKGPQSCPKSVPQRPLWYGTQI